MITKNGIVTAAKMKDTITVTVHQPVMHKLYKKSFRSSKKFLVDLNNVKDVQVGDEVLIGECRPLSKRKHFKLLEVTKRSPRVSEMTEEKGLEEAMHRVKNEKSEKSETTKKSADEESSQSSISSTSSSSSAK